MVPNDSRNAATLATGISRLGSSGVSRFGSSGISRSGRSGVSLFGRSGVSRSGKSGVSPSGSFGVSSVGNRALLLRKTTLPPSGTLSGVNLSGWQWTCPEAITNCALSLLTAFPPRVGDESDEYAVTWGYIRMLSAHSKPSSTAPEKGRREDGRSVVARARRASDLFVRVSRSMIAKGESHYGTQRPIE